MADKKISQLSSAGPLTGTEPLPIVQGGVTVKTTVQDIANLAGGGISGTNYLFVAADGTSVENGTALQAAYDEAKTMSPTADNIITIIAAPGNYDISSYLLMDTQYINLVSLTGNIDVILNRIDLVDPFQTNIAGEITNYGEVIKIIEDYITLVGISGKLRNSPNFNSYWGEGEDYVLPIRIINNLPNLYIKNCQGGDFGFGSNENSWNALSEPVVLSGTFVDCAARFRSFGNSGEPSGTFINCQATSEYLNSSAFGLNTNISGYFENCKGDFYAFNAWGTFDISGTFVNCTGGYNSFGSQFNTTVSGIFVNCVGGSGSFGRGQNPSFPPTLTGKLFYCRLTSGPFGTVSGGGRTYYCVDGNGNVNNQ